MQWSIQRGRDIMLVHFCYCHGQSREERKRDGLRSSSFSVSFVDITVRELMHAFVVVQ